MWHEVKHLLSVVLVFQIVNMDGPVVFAQVTTPTVPALLQIQGLLHAGRYHEALGALEDFANTGGSRLPTPHTPSTTTFAGASVTPSATELALLTAVLMNSWAPVATINVTTLTARDQSSYWYVRGVLTAWWAWPGGTRAHLDAAQQAADELERLAASEGTLSRSAVRRSTVLAAMAGAQEERDELALLLGHARHLDDQLAGMGAAGDVVLPLAEVAGDLWLRLHRFDDAERYYREAIDQFPQRTRAWVGLARAAREAGRSVEARQAATRVLALWRDSEDAARSEIEALGPQ